MTAPGMGSCYRTLVDVLTSQITVVWSTSTHQNIVSPAVIDCVILGHMEPILLCLYINIQFCQFNP